MLDSFLGIDPTGAQAALLCAATGALLVVLIVVGFLVLRRGEPPGSQGRLRAAEVDLVALWRLGRAVRRSLPGASRASRI